jgi:hypothetical protein
MSLLLRYSCTRFRCATLSDTPSFSDLLAATVFPVVGRTGLPATLHDPLEVPVRESVWLDYITRGSKLNRVT